MHQIKEFPGQLLHSGSIGVSLFLDEQVLQPVLFLSVPLLAYRSGNEELNPALNS
jgi:hypothetical protein